jgi:hypothetical protein
VKIKSDVKYRILCNYGFGGGDYLRKEDVLVVDHINQLRDSKTNLYRDIVYFKNNFTLPLHIFMMIAEEVKEEVERGREV